MRVGALTVGAAFVATLSTNAAAGSVSADASADATRVRRSDAPPLPQPFTPAEQEEIWSMLSTRGELSVDQIHAALSYFQRAVSARALRSDSLESQALLRILASYHDWRLPIAVARDPTRNVAGQERLITFPSADGQFQVVTAFSSTGDVSEDMKQLNSNDQFEMASMPINGVGLFQSLMQMSRVPSDQRVGALSINAGAQAKKNTHVTIPIDGGAQFFLMQAVGSVIQTRLLQQSSRADFLQQHLGALFTRGAPGRWFTVAQGPDEYLSNSFGDADSERQNLLLFAGPEMALQYLRLSKAAPEAYVQPLQPHQVAPLLKDNSLNAVFVHEILPKTGELDVRQFGLEEFETACTAAAAQQAQKPQ